MRRAFDALEEAQEFRDREAELTREQQEALKPDTVIDRELVEGPPRKLGQQVAGRPLEELQQYELRHYFAPVVIATGAGFSETAAYFGNSEVEIRRTCAHLVRETDEIRRAAGQDPGVTAPSR